MPYKKTKYVTAKNVISQEIDGETVLLDMDGENYFGLNAVGTRVWQLLREPNTLENIFAALVIEYNVEASQLKADLDEIIDRLLIAGLITKVTNKADDV
jgi:hypothetical protein